MLKVYAVRNEVSYLSTKTYGHEIGLSAVFRQWRADSHCNKLHGYALSFKFVFEASELDYRNWVVDFGGLKGLKTSLEYVFDHKTVVASDDPLRKEIEALSELGIADVVIVPAVGCEMFAALGAELASQELRALGIDERVKVVEVACSEHGANSAIYRP